MALGVDVWREAQRLWQPQPITSPSTLQESQSQKGLERPQALAEVSPTGGGGGLAAGHVGGWVGGWAVLLVLSWGGQPREIVLPPLQMPSSPGGLHSPEQRSFRERQKYFEVELKQQPAEKPPKRVSLVGEEDLRKMKEEEGEGH